LKVQSSPEAIAHRNLMMAPLSCPEPTNFNGASNHHLMGLPRSDTPCDFSVDYNQDQSLLLTCPPLFSRTISSESQWYRPYDLQADTTDSTTYTNQTSVQGMHHPFHFDTMPHVDDNDLCFSFSPHNTYDFEPLPFRDDDELCDDFANFIQCAIQQVEG
jgi:hypothetical protein